MPNKLSNLNISFVSFCEKGKNPEAEVAFFKMADKPKDLLQILAKWRMKHPQGSKEEFKKFLGDEEPRTFDEIREDERMIDVYFILLDRQDQLTMSIWEILMKGEGDKKKSVIESITQFLDSVEMDFDDLIEGRMLKSKREPTKKEGSHLPKSKTNDKVDLKKLDPSKIEDEETRKLVEAAIKRAGEADDAEERATKAEVERDELKKKHEPDPPTPPAEDVPEGVKKQFESMEQINKAQAEKIEKLEKDARRRELLEKAKGFNSLGEEQGALTDLLEKAQEAGILDEVTKIFTAVNERAKKADSLTIELGKGSGASDSGSAAWEKIESLAREMVAKEASMTMPQAIEKVIQANPDLERQYSEEMGVGRDRGQAH